MCGVTGTERRLEAADAACARVTSPRRAAVATRTRATLMALRGSGSRHAAAPRPPAPSPSRPSAAPPRPLRVAPDGTRRCTRRLVCVLGGSTWSWSRCARPGVAGGGPRPGLAARTQAVAVHRASVDAEGAARHVARLRRLAQHEKEPLRRRSNQQSFVLAEQRARVHTHAVSHPDHTHPRHLRGNSCHGCTKAWRA